MVSQDVAAAKAAVLIESLPWLRRYHGATIVVKFGGNAMIDDELKRSFAEDMVYLRTVGLRPVVVHGGGPQITAELTRRGIPSEFRGGYRVTTEESIGVVRQVLAEQVGGELVGLINEHGAIAEGISGDEGGLFTGERRSTIIDGEVVDLGLVGEVTAVDPTRVLQVLDVGGIPVVSTVANGPDSLLNVNADSAAASLAIAVKAAKLVVLTDVAGLYRDWPDRDSLISVIAVDELAALLPSLESGMIPKMTACLDAVRAGVPTAAVIDGRVPHSILLEIFTRGGIGTEVVPE
ncbi:acetylglutamate kinase [Leifsonia sp. H3M29-4]|uniref:acetylglutamate kinase n=1 Tax=Salinibacterium metalliresistens TaxID=3031321 RepID=UPI0023DAB8E5|nr:acetylglutamate kinase [Salinibacterium metalliresistens]MDF1479005.1 acetylglutamate kinase [Salinibacterium metalliresistens]